MRCQQETDVVIDRAMTGDGEWEYEYGTVECQEEAVWFDEGVAVCQTHAIEEWGVSEAAFR